MKMLHPANRTTSGLQTPTRLARADGSPKMPLPMTQLMTAAVRLHRPIARMSDGLATPTRAIPVPLVFMSAVVAISGRCAQRLQLTRGRSPFNEADWCSRVLGRDEPMVSSSLQWCSYAARRDPAANPLVHRCQLPVFHSPPAISRRMTAGAVLQMWPDR